MNDPDRHDTIFLADYLDDVYEPEDAEKLLRQLASERSGGQPAGTPYCLRVVGDDVTQAKVLQKGYKGGSERIGTAAYLWALCSGPTPTREAMVELYLEHKKARGA